VICDRDVVQDLLITLVYSIIITYILIRLRECVKNSLISSIIVGVNLILELCLT